MLAPSRIRFLLPFLAAMLISIVASSSSFAQKEMAGPLQFKVRIDQLRGINVELVDGFEWSSEVSYDLGSRTSGAGRVTYPTITLRHKADGSRAVWNWYKSVHAGGLDSTPGAIDLVDGTGIVARTYTLPLMIPSRYRLINTPDGVVEEIEVVVVNPTGELK